MPRTPDTTYGPEYWQSFDGGVGYGDGSLWEDTAHLIKEVFCYDRSSLQKDLSSGFQILDVGCAFGYLVYHLHRRGVEAWGLDFSKFALDSAPEEISDHLQLHDIGDADGSLWGNEFFNLITCLETMEHLDNSQITIALKKIYLLLKPGGYALFSICVSEYSDPYDDPTHVTILPRRSWEKRFRFAGFEIATEKEKAIRAFWLYHDHPGVFVVKRPL